MPSLLIIQWGIVGFYAVVYFLLGFLRGGSKSTYFTIVAFITTFISLYLISFISLNLILNDSFTLVSLLEMANGYAGGIIPETVFTYAADPMLAAFAIAIIDLILRIVGFIIIYPILKGLLTLIIFRPIWSFGIKKALLRRQNEKFQEEAMTDGDGEYKPRKRLKKTLLGRFWGGFMGSAQGLLVAFMILLPVLILSGFLTVNRPETVVSHDENSMQLVAIPGIPDLGGLVDQVDEYLLQIDEMNQKGLGSFMKQITVEGVPFDRYIFDRIFTTQVKQGETVTDINWMKEVEGILQITRVIYDGGYLDPEFGPEDINVDTIGDVEIVFNYFKNSDLMAHMIPTATAFGLDMFRDQLPANISEELADRAVAGVQDIDWNEEFGHIQEVIEAILTFGSYEELQAYMADPYLMLDLTPEQGVELANIVRAIGDMQILELIPIAVEYATTIESIKANIGWIAEEERQAYIEEKLSFLIDNPAFFNGQDGEFSRLALLIEGIYTDEFGDVNLRQLISTSDAEAFLAAQNEEWIDNILEKVIDLELLLNAIPMGVDFVLYSQVGDLVDETLASELETALSEISWEDEILNVGEIYKTAVQAGAGELLKDSPNTMLFIDGLFLNHMDKARTLVEQIFEGSALVNAAIEIASPVLVDRFVTNPDVAAIVKEALMSDPESGDVDFSIGQELNTILDIVEKMYLFTTAEEVANFGGLTTESKFELFAGFGSLSTAQFDDLKESFESLQLLNRVSESGLIYVRDVMGIAQLYVPEGVNLGEDIGSILGLAYYVAKYTNEHKVLYPTYEAIDFAPLFADETFRSYFLPTELNNHSNFLISNIAFNAKYYSSDPSLSQYLKVPQTLMDASPESNEWKEEMNALLGAIFDLAASFEDSDVFTLSYSNIIGFRDAPTQASIELITQFADPLKADETFGSLDSSVILRSSMKQAIDSFGSSTVDALGGYALKTPAMAIEDEMLKEGMFVELINGLAILIDDMNDTWQFTTIEELKSGLGVDSMLPAFNNLDDSSLISFGNITIIRGVISDALLSTEIKNFGIEKLNGAQTFFTAPADFLDLDPLLLDADGVKGDEIGKLLISVKSLQLPNQEALSSFGPIMMNEMVGRNLVGTMDDLSRFFDSGILYTFLDKAFKLDGINDYVNEMLSGAFGEAEITIDITPHAAILGNEVDDEPIEIGRITKDEFRNMVISLGLISPIGEVGIQTFPNMIDPLSDQDDFTTFLNSDYIYTVVGRLFENQGFGDYIGGFLAGAFGEGIELDMTTPVDAKGTVGVENEIITKYELRRIMVSFKLIGLDQGTENISEEKILNLKGQNLVAGKDDFDRFIESKYIADKLSIILTSDTVIELMATGRFLASDFELLPSAYTMIGGRKRITNDEFANIFGGLKLMGLTSFSDTSGILDNLSGLEEPDVLEILESYFLYTFIDLMLKSETSITVPLTALESSGEFDGMVKKSEVADIFVALSIFKITVGNVPDPAEITIEQLQQLLEETDSAIVQSLLSDAIIEALGAENVPADALESENLLTQVEIDAIVEALAVISGNNKTPITEVAEKIELLTVGQVNDIDLTETGSATIKQMISDSILDALDASIIPDGALNPLSSNNHKVLLSMNLADDDPVVLTRLTDFELEQIILALNILAGSPDILVTKIPTDVTVGKARSLQTTQSLIIRQFMTDKITTSLSSEVTFPSASFDLTHNSLLSYDEVEELLDAIAVLAYDNPDDDPEYDVNDEEIIGINMNLVVGDAVALKDSDSYIIRQLITDKMEGILGSEVTFPVASYDQTITTMLSKAEIGHMIDALQIFAYNNPTNDPSYNVNEEPITGISPDVNVGKAVDLKGTDSLIIRQLITDKIGGILETELTFPSSAYDQTHTTMLTKAEVGYMIDALVVLAYDNPTNDPNYDVNDEPITGISPDINVGKAKDLKQTDSLIIRQLMTIKIEDILESELTFPDEAYDIENVTMLSKTEIGHMIDALVILAYDNQTDDPSYDVDLEPITGISPDVTVGKARGLKENGSYIVRQLVTNNVETALLTTVDFPSEAYDSEIVTMFTQDEIKEIIDALYVLSGENDDLPVASIPINVTVGQTQDLKSNDSIIIRQLISDSIVDTLTTAGSTIPDGAYIDSETKDRLTNIEINHMIDALYILSDEDDDMLVADVPTDITIGQLDELTESYSMIMQKLITDSIVDAVTVDKVPDDAYLANTVGNNLKEAEAGAMVDALRILAYDPLDPLADVDSVKVSFIDIDVTVGQTVLLKTNGSVIIKQIISDSIVTMLTAPKIRVTAYMNGDPNLRITNDEIGYMIDALYDLSGEDNDKPVKNITVNENSLSIDILQEFNENSIILNRLISNAVIDSLGANNIPIESYEDSDAKKDLIRPEIDAILFALETLGIGTSGAGGIGMADLTFTDLDTVVAIGTTDNVNYPLGFSPIVVHLLSDPMIAAVTDIRSGFEYGVPSTAYRNTIDLLHDEIEGLVAALKLIGNVQPEDEEDTTVNDIIINTDNFGYQLINDLVALDTLIVYRLISKSINEVDLDTVPSHVNDVIARNYDQVLLAVLPAPEIYDIKISEMSHIANSMFILGVGSIADLGDIELSDLTGLDAQDIEDLVEAVVPESDANTIIYYLIAETVDPTNHTYDGFPFFLTDADYVMDSGTRVRLLRTTIVDILG